VVPMIAIWTGMLLVVSLFHLNEFDFSRDQTKTWFAAYIIYPLIAMGLAWRDHAHAHEDALPGAPLPRWVRGYLLGQGVVATALGLALLLAPNGMTALWPWKITPLLTQIYSAPLLSYGIGSLLLARRRTWAEVRVATTATLVFTAGVLLASLIHRNLFAGTLATWLWFGGFAIATLMLGLIAGRAWQPQRQRATLAHA
jgi:hypothetical protein